MIKLQILLATICTGLAFGATISFSDDVDVVSGTPITLDTSAYTNTIIGTGAWLVEANPFSSSMSSLEVNHYISLLSSGTLDVVTVYGVSSGMLELTANPSHPTNEQSFEGQSGALPNEYVFNLSGYDLGQGGVTVIDGFDSISRINFSGSYATIPEPSVPILLAVTAIGLALTRNKCRTRRCTQPPARRESNFSG